MDRTKLFIVAIVLLLITQTTFAQPCDFVQTYSAAREKSMLENRPLLVLLTTRNCAPCEEAKLAFDEYQKQGLLDPCVFVIVDEGVSPDDAASLRKGLTKYPGYPLFVLFFVKDTEWTRVAGRPKKVLDAVNQMRKENPRVR